jgi:hypothetical protein
VQGVLLVSIESACLTHLVDRRFHVRNHWRQREQGTIRQRLRNTFFDAPQCQGGKNGFRAALFEEERPADIQRPPQTLLFNERGQPRQQPRRAFHDS